MFTGIIEAIGSVQQQIPQAEGDLRLVIGSGSLDMGDVSLGDSIAVNGVCLTVIEYGENFFAADVSGETLACTTLGLLHTGAPVNLEKALLPTTRLGGHLVSGHVDGVGSIVSIRPDARSIRFALQAPPALSRFIAAKGSICIEGISLTVNSVEDDRFSVNIVPHTLVNTTLKAASEGQPVNLEVDVLARYLERLLQGRPETDTSETDISLDLLDRAGLVQPQK